MSFARYPAYKDSGVEWLGEVPEHWGVPVGRRIYRQVREQAHAGDVQLSATQKYGVIPQSEFMEAEDQKVMLALKGLDNFKHVEKNDFVISLRSFQGGIEHSAYSGCVSPAYTVLRAQQEIDPSYMAFALKSSGYISALQSATDGIRDGKNISYDQFGSIGLPLPSLPEQTAIATFLDRETARIDALVVEQERLIALLKEKRQAVISHAVTKGLNPDAPMKDSGVEWLGEVPAHWEVRPFKTLIDRNDGGVWGDDPSGEGDTMVLRSTEQAVDGRWQLDDPAFRKLSPSERESALLELGDLLVTKSSGSSLHIGKTTLVDTKIADLKCCYSNFMQRIRLYSDFAPKLAWYFMNNGVVRQQFDFLSNSTTGLANLNGTMIGQIITCVPPTQEQTAIVAFLDTETTKLDALIEEADSAITFLQERRAALISAAVTGQIDVRRLACDVKTPYSTVDLAHA